MLPVRRRHGILGRPFGIAFTVFFGLAAELHKPSSDFLNGMSALGRHHGP